MYSLLDGKTKELSQRWNADQYHCNSSIQFESSRKILQKISFRGNEKVLDIGCGDGKITARISSYLPNGEIIGIDLSPEMIKYANENFGTNDYPNVSFHLQNGSNIEFLNQFDIIFSSFALHWIIDFDAFLTRVYRSLKKNGKIVFTIPLGISTPLKQSTEEIMRHAKWNRFFIDYKEPWRFSNSAEYKSMIENAGFNITSLNVVSDKKVFDSRDAFENYVVQWYPYINFVDPELRREFFIELFDRYLEIEPCSSSGTVNFEYFRIDLIAQRD